MFSKAVGQALKHLNHRKMSTEAKVGGKSLLINPTQLYEIIQSQPDNTVMYFSPLIYCRLSLTSRGCRLDATWFMPNVQRNAEAEWQTGPRIPSARYWNHDEVATLGHPLNLPHMLPSKEIFARACCKF